MLVWGDHFGAADVAEQLAFTGHRVTVITPHAEFASWMEPCHRDIMFKRFAGGNGEGLKGRSFAHPVTVIPHTSVLEIQQDGTVVLLDSQFRKSTVHADTVVLADVQPNDDLYVPLLEAGTKVVKIGDARQVRNLRGAITDGANVALCIEADAVLNANLQLVSNLPSEITAGHPLHVHEVT